MKITFVGAGPYDTNISVAMDDVKITTKECEIHPTFALPGKSVKVGCFVHGIEFAHAIKSAVS